MVFVPAPIPVGGIITAIVVGAVIIFVVGVVIGFLIRKYVFKK